MEKSQSDKPRAAPRRKESMSLWGKLLWSMMAFAARQLGFVYVDVYAPGKGDERRVRGITFSDDKAYVAKVGDVEAESKVKVDETEGERC